jgi:uncharacterized protein
MNKILPVLLIAFFTISTTYGQKDSLTAFDNKTDAATGKFKLPPPSNPIGYTSDFEHILLPNEIDTLDLIIKHFENETTIQIAIVTIDSSYTTKEDFDDFITELANAWGVGYKSKNNGITIGISAGLRKIRISNGYGIEAKLSDNETKRIIDEIMLPEFKEGNYYNGLKKGLAVITVKLR